MNMIKKRTLSIYTTRIKCVGIVIVTIITSLSIVTSTCSAPSHKPSDFYGIKLVIFNKSEIERDLNRDWTQYYPDPIDEDSRYELSLLEELETRRGHLNLVFNVSFEEDGDLPRLILNRISHPIPDRFFEVPHTYAILEHIESYLFHHFEHEEWESKKARILNEWLQEEWVRKVDFLIEMKEKGVNVSAELDYYEYFDYYVDGLIDIIYLDKQETTYESLGYVPQKIEYPPEPKPKGPVFGFNLWQQEK